MTGRTASHHSLFLRLALAQESGDIDGIAGGDAATAQQLRWAVDAPYMARRLVGRRAQWLHLWLWYRQTLRDSAQSLDIVIQQIEVIIIRHFRVRRQWSRRRLHGYPLPGCGIRSRRSFMLHLRCALDRMIHHAPLWGWHGRVWLAPVHTRLAVRYARRYCRYRVRLALRLVIVYRRVSRRHGSPPVTRRATVKPGCDHRNLYLPIKVRVLHRA